MTLEEFHLALEEIADGLPKQLFDRLNGGVNIREKVCMSPESVPQAPRYILGQYHRDRVMGRWIDLYYGSFAHVFSHAGDHAWRQEMERVLKHELRHHLEDQAGENTLREEDKRDVATYKVRYHQREEEK